MRKNISIRVTVILVFIFGTLVTAATAISLQYLFSSRIATEVVTSYSANLARHIQNNVTRLELTSSHAVELLAHNKSILYEDRVIPDVVDPLFISLLKNHNELYNVHIGLENGDLYTIANLKASPSIPKKLGASPTDRYAKIIIEGSGRQRTRKVIFLDEQMNVTGTKVETSKYDASTRPWFIDARQTHTTISPPYLFQHLQAPGQTVSMKIVDTNHVIAVDITLANMSAFLSEQIKQESESAIQNSDVFIYDSEGVIIASNSSITNKDIRKIKPLKLSQQEQEYIQSLSTLRVSNETDWAPFDYSISGNPHGYIVEKTEMLAQSLGLSIKHVNGFSWSELIEYFHAGNIEILVPVYKTESRKDWGLFSDPIINAKMALATHSSSPDYHSLKELKGKVVAIPDGWSVAHKIEKYHPEIKLMRVESIVDALQAVIDGRADVVLDVEVTLRYNLDIYHLSDIKIIKDLEIHPDFDTNLYYLVHPEHKQLLSLINRALKQFSVQDSAYLEYKWLDINNRQALAKSLSHTVPYNELLTLAEDESRHDILQRLTIESQDKFVFVSPLLGIPNQYFAIVLDANEVLAHSKKNVYTSIAITITIIFFLLPLSWFLANPIVSPINQLALENQKIMRRQFHQVKRRSFMIKEVHELSGSLVDMSEAIAEHEAQQQNLMDSFVKLIAQAIDDKSHYTGEHCRRVPELGLMLASAASKDQSDYFKGFSIEDRDKQREFQLAAWLHDCGKITTPEHVVDKGSKLETNYNRIHEIRTRFEVIRRDLEIDYYQQLLKHPANQKALQQAKTEAQQALTDDFIFVAKCNVGSEGMDEKNITRLNQIARKKWIRYFDDQLGLSPQEESRLKSAPAALPATEYLIDDKPEHEIEWERKPFYDPKFGITLEAPSLQNHQGELYNLSTIRGTLNSEERYRIKEHMVSTIKILESLPFPPELANVPKYASTHHETLKGTGYPRGLSADDLSIGERILVLADIFEALTASDRPYKKAKPLSVTLNIMRNMVLDEHIDQKVFNLFLSSGIYMTYAKQYLKEEQIDEIKPEDYLL